MSEATDGLPEGWAEATVGDLFQIVGGGTPSTKDPAFWDGDIPWITSADIGPDHVIRPKRSIAPSAVEASATNLVPEGSVVVVTRVGLGKVGLAETDLTFSQDSQALVFDKEVLDPRFVVHQMGQLVGVFKSISRGTTISGVTKAQLRALPFQVPPINEQRRIVAQAEALLARVASVRDRLERVPTILRRFRQAVLAAACDGRLTADWRAANPDAEPASVLLDRIATERRAHLGRKYRDSAPLESRQDDVLPTGWVYTSVDALAFVGTGATPLRRRSDFYEGGTIPWVTSGAVNTPLITHAGEHITPLAIKETNAKLFPAGTLLIAMYGEGQTRGRVAELGIEAATNQALAALVFEGAAANCKPMVKLSFLSNYEALRHLSAGGVQPNLSLGIIRSTPVLLPPEKEQEEIVRRTDALLTLADKAEVRVKRARGHAEQTAQSVLSKAFRGELVPTESELARAEGREYESGADLLARIQSTQIAARSSQRRKAVPLFD